MNWRARARRSSAALAGLFACACLTPPLPPEATPKTDATVAEDVEGDVEPIASAEPTEPSNDDAKPSSEEAAPKFEELEPYQPSGEGFSYCFEPEALERREADLAADRLIAEQLAGLASCHEGKISRPEFVRVEVALGRRQAPEVTTSIATVTDCSVAQCIAERFEQVKWPAHLVGRIVDLVLTPDSAPKRVESRSMWTASRCGTPKPALHLAATEFLNGEIKPFADRFQACYATALKTDKTLRGDMIVWVRLEGEGRVVATELVGSSVRDCAMVACVINELTQLQFPGHDGSASTIASFRFPMEAEPTP